MSWDRIEGQWKQRRGKAAHHWGKMMNDELAAIAGKYEELVGRLQEQYGVAKEEAHRQVNDFKKMIRKLQKTNDRLLKTQKGLITQRKPEKKSPKSKMPTKKRSRAVTHGK